MIGFAKKIGMTRLFVDGKHVAVTAIQFSPSVVIQKKTKQIDGYSSVQIGAFKKSKSKSDSASKGHTKKHTGVESTFIYVEEFKDIELDDSKKEFSVKDFSENDELDITGLTIGRGFAGVVKRHGFAGQPASHGHDHVRAPGSIGSRWPQRVGKGKKMAGHMGNVRKTLKSVKIIAIDTDNSLIFVNGSVQGANTSILKIKKVNK
jgi:large subunit ribosomal protein L3